MPFLHESFELSKEAEYDMKNSADVGGNYTLNFLFYSLIMMPTLLEALRIRTKHDINTVSTVSS